jgi:glycerate 2-kinase
VPSVDGIPRPILVAPDSFKGTLGSFQVAGAIGAGLHAAGAEVELCPLADGGEGTVEVLGRAWGAHRRTANVHDPLDRPTQAEFALASGVGRSGNSAIVEAAAASGLGLVARRDVDPVAASTAGTGELILAAVEAGAETIYVGVGGSATTDGGAGAIRAIRQGGGLRGARLVVLTDVRTPFEEAARVYGPQKGAGPAQVRALTRRLHRLARGFRRDPRGIPLTGAAGGLSGGLWAEFGAVLVPGASFILDAIDFDRRLRASRAVVTGEGKLDAQSLAGKAVSEVATRARQAGVPCYAVAGRGDLDAFGMRLLDLQAVLEAGTLNELEQAGRATAGLVFGPWDRDGRIE